MTSRFKQAVRLCNKWFGKATHLQAQAQIGSIEFHSNGFGEQGYPQPESGIIALGNWNNITAWNPVTCQFDTLDTSPSKLYKALTAIGVACDYFDEWTPCDTCGKLYRTVPDSYSWTKSLATIDGKDICEDCVDPAVLLRSCEADATKCITLDLDPADHGYLLIRDHLEAGVYGGQNADPQVIASRLRDLGVHTFVFRQDIQSQFFMRFSVYLHESESALLREAQAALRGGNCNGPDRVAAMEKALKDPANCYELDRATGKLVNIKGESL